MPRIPRTPLLCALVSSLCLSTFAAAIDESTSVTLRGNVHPLVAAANISKAVDDATPMEHMILFLKADATQETQLAQLIAQQHDPKSPLFHQFLTPKQFGSQFGTAPANLAKATSWLQSHGFTVEEVPAGQRAIIFSGTSGQAAAAFRTEIRSYRISGADHLANASDPQIPAQLSSIVGGIVKLHDFRHTANIARPAAVTGQFTYGSSHYLSPADYGTIYNINPLYAAGINGTGQTIAVLARSNIYMSDVQTFRSQFGLKANNPQIVITNGDPGVLQGDSVETTLDTEWSGAIAPNATVKVIVAASTNTADGIDLSALYAVNNKVAPIVSLSYGSCEAGMGSSELAFYNSLWQQAAAQGMSVFVSSGDSGAAGCYGGSSTSGSGQAINGLCSSPYATCVGGTEFAEGNNPGQYWLPGNNPVYGSATGYIPETVWNESGSNGGSGLWAGGGGASIAFSKPAYQTGPGVPSDARRDVPDVSLTASGHDGYLIQLYGGLNSVGGTSASAPSFAGLMALVNQKANAPQGLANAILYPLAVNQASGGPAVFHDTISGNNSVPGVPGFSAAKGYDLASGLGSVDATLLVNHWSDLAKTAPATISLATSASSLSLVPGKTAQATITFTASATLKAAVTFTVSGAPTGLSATFVPATIAAPGSGSVTLNLTAAATIAPGTYSLTITAQGGGQTAKLPVSVIVLAPSFSLATSAASLTAGLGKTTQLSLATSLENGFNAAISLKLAGLPAAVTALFSQTNLPAPGSGTLTATFTIATTAKPGTYPLTLTATGGGITRTANLSLTIGAAPGFTFAVSVPALTIQQGKPANLVVSTGNFTGGFNSTITLMLTGLAPGMNYAFVSGAAANNLVNITYALSASSATAVGTYPITVTASGAGIVHSTIVQVTVTKATAAKK